MKTNYYLLLTLILCATLTFAQDRQEFKITLFAQGAFPGYNDVSIPNDGATLFSLTKDLDAQSMVFSPRLELSYRFARRHNVILMASLLTVKSDGALDRDVKFNGVVFAADTHLDALYRFNSYRLTYRYTLVDREKFRFDLGLTAKIRQARVSLSSDDKSSTYDNVGFAPLLSYNIEYRPTSKIAFMSYGDAFAVSVGRAEDIFVGVCYDISSRTSVLGGYRMLEGGSDSEKVYTFAFFSYASVGVSVRL